MKTEFLKDPKAGDIAFSYPVALGFYSRAVRFFTKSMWSHCFFLCDDYLGQRMVFESDLKAQLVPFEKEYIESQVDAYELYRPSRARGNQITEACKFSFYVTAGETYGFLSIPWFALRETIFWITGKKLGKNFKKSGSICSESLLLYIHGLGEEYGEAFKHLTRDETSPEDIYKVVKSRPDLFHYIGRRM
jgi:hypothetical protein